MPLIILCGQPSSGKSTVAAAIEHQLKQKQKDVIVISEQTLHQDRNAAYSGMYTCVIEVVQHAIDTEVLQILPARKSSVAA